MLGFIGGIKPKLDFKIIKEAAHAKDRLDIFICRSGWDQWRSIFSSAAEASNVIWTGPAAPKEVPALYEANGHRHHAI